MKEKNMSNKVLVVFTAQSVETILAKGGSLSWRLDRNNARKCDFVICTRNAYADWVQGTEDHHSAFLIGKIKDVVPSPDHEGRYLILFSKFARVNIPEVWKKGDRNPVHYSSREDLDIEFEALEWEAMPEYEEEVQVPENNKNSLKALTIDDAKKGLALTFGISPESIEITIRG